MSSKEIKEVELILSKLKIVSEEKERGLYLCDKEHSKLLLDYITNLQQRIEKAVDYIKQYGNLYCLKHQQFKQYYQYEELLNILNDKE